MCNVGVMTSAGTLIFTCAVPCGFQRTPGTHLKSDSKWPLPASVNSIGTLLAYVSEDEMFNTSLLLSTSLIHGNMAVYNAEDGKSIFHMLQSGMPSQRLQFSLKHFLTLVQCSVQVPLTVALQCITQGMSQRRTTKASYRRRRKMVSQRGITNKVYDNNPLKFWRFR